MSVESNCRSMQPSRGVATAVGFVVAAVVAGGVTFTAANPGFVVGLAATVLLATTLGVWAGPRVNDALPEVPDDDRLDALVGGVAGGLAAALLVVPVFLFELSVWVRFAVGLWGAAAAMLGLAGGYTVVVVRLDRPADDTGDVSASDGDDPTVTDAD